MSDTPPQPRRPVPTAELVVDAIRSGHTTRDAIVAHTGINPSAVGIALKHLYDNQVVDREAAPYEGRPGPRGFVYSLTDQT